ncbi:MAG TPA: hypothetical protein VHC63_00275 [Acidimicrobiales bacterium]|nr:hypothetical protein [Acidimicrobiales bacterium]
MPETAIDQHVVVPSGTAQLSGHLAIPASARGVVIFAHGSGSSRLSPRNRYVAEILNAAKVGTLLFDLLTPDEEVRRSNVFDIELLASRLLGATTFTRRALADTLPLGYFGASTGAAAALWAAAELGRAITAVVSRGGRPDLAAGRLAEVTAPTLLIVGGEDHVVLELNRDALALLRCPAKLVEIAGATHVFRGARHAGSRRPQRARLVRGALLAG